MFKEHRFASGESHYVVHRIVHALNEASRCLRVFVTAFAWGGFVGFLVPVEIVVAAGDAVNIVNADVEPDR